MRQFQLASAALCAIIPALGIYSKHVRFSSNAGARIVMTVLELFTFNTAVVKTPVHCEMFLEQLLAPLCSGTPVLPNPRTKIRSPFYPPFGFILPRILTIL